MMACMLGQLPLPLLQPGAAEIAPGVGLLTGEDGGLVIVHGLATFAWDAGDEAGRRLAAVQLVRLRAASRGRWRRRSGWTRPPSGGGTRRWPRPGWPGWSRPAAGRGAHRS